MIRTAGAASFALIAVLGWSAVLAAPPAGGRSTTPPTGAPAKNDGATKGEGARPDGQRGDGPRRGMPPLSEEMFEQVIAVAKDVSPEFGDQLEKLRNLTPEEKTQAMRQNARRLITLAVLKKRNIELYETRVKELRVQLELHALGEKYVAAEAANDKATMATLSVEIEKKVKQQVNLDLKARAQELDALVKQFDQMKEDLQQDTKETAERVAERIEAVKKGQPIKSRGFPGDGDGRPRDGDGKPHDGEGKSREGAKPKSNTP